MRVNTQFLPLRDTFPPDPELTRLVTQLAAVRSPLGQGRGRLEQITTKHQGRRLDIWLDWSAWDRSQTLFVVGAAVSMEDLDPGTPQPTVDGAGPEPVFVGAAVSGGRTYARRSYVRDGRRWELCAVRGPWRTIVSLSRWTEAQARTPPGGGRLLELVTREPRAVGDPPAGLAVAPADSASYSVEGAATLARRPLLVEEKGVVFWWRSARDLEDCMWAVQPWLPYGQMD